ncbi:MAG: hypothetical protein GF333_05275 [Candidatus Omnitrophica bacterium]|nr:hypothetical protein [Candidatus Omnitrophota bacterium]
MRRTKKIAYRFFMTVSLAVLFALPGRAQEDFTYRDAIDEIDQMIETVLEVEETQVDLLNKSILWECYYTDKGEIPAEVAATDFVKPSDWGMDFSYFQEEEKLNKFTHKREILQELKESKQYLKRFKNFYRRYPPVQEIRYLREGMKVWKEHIADFHAALDEYFGDIAEFMKLEYYERIVMYNERLKKLKEEYQGNLTCPEYVHKKKQLDIWREEVAEEAAKIEDTKFGYGVGESWRALQSCTEREFFTDLKEEFLPRLVVLKLNKVYLVKSAQLEKLDSESREAERLRREIARKRKEIKILLHAEQEKYGAQWKERYRDPVTGFLPGGLVEDSFFGEIKTVVVNMFSRGELPVRREGYSSTINLKTGVCDTIESCAGIGPKVEM